MLQKKNTYIYSIDGKDLYDKIHIISKEKKFKASFDYSLEAIQIQKIAYNIFDKKHADNIFYQDDKNKQYTNKVINLNFKYNIREYEPVTVNKYNYYVYYKYKIEEKNLNNLEFDNGLYIENNKILVIKIGDDCKLKSKDGPKGFIIKKEKNQLSATGINIIANCDEIRNELYKNGFKVKIGREVIKYVRFKRSSGSSRIGKCLFIDERLYKPMMEWSMMDINLKKKEKIDLAALEAYVALTTSSIIDTINIYPQNILLIDHYDSVFEDVGMVTEIVSEKYKDEYGKEKERDILYTEPKKIKISNSIWDGQSLLDESLFCDKYKDKGMLLLRNRFFKSCCFNTKIQKFFKDNNITKLSQIHGKTLAKKIEDIKLITTPNSIKYLKFGTWEKYIKQLESTFGIVKYDKPTNHFEGKMVQCHYQLLNTLQLSKSDMKELLEPSLKYIDNLKNNNAVLRYHLKIKMNSDNKSANVNNTNELIFALLSLNNDFYNTDLCYKFKKNLVESYINNIKKGHILLNGNYSTLCGNGLEMLKDSCGMFNGESLLDENEVYCKNFELEKNLIGSRSPHITMSNIWLPKNTNKYKASIINKYFNTTNEIIYINSINNNILELLSGCDFDSDQILVSDNELLISRAKLNYNNFLVSTSNVEAKKIKRFNISKEKSDLDIKTSKNLIGEIVNCSAFLNALLWDYINTKKYKVDDEYIQELYKAISQLNVMSCIEIDKAKKEFSIDNHMELDKIKKTWCSDEKPLFFKQFAKDRIDKENDKIDKINKNRDMDNKILRKHVNEDKFKKHECSLDYLIEIMSNIKRMRKQSKFCTIEELLIKNSVKIKPNDINTFNKLILKTNNVNNKRLLIWENNELTNEEKFIQYNEEKEKLIEEIKKMNITEGVIKKIYKLLDKEIKCKRSCKKIKNTERRLEDINKKISKENKYINERKKLMKKIKDEEKNKLECEDTILPIQRLLMTSLYYTNKNSFMKLFKENKKEMEYIIERNEENLKISNEEIDIYNYKYLLYTNFH